MPHRTPCRRPGLTLIELLVVLAIFILLSVLVIPLLAQTEARKTREAARVVASVIAKAQSLAISGGQGASVRFNQMHPTSKAFSEIVLAGPKRCYRGESATARCKLVETNGLGPDMLNHYEWYNANLPSPADRYENETCYELLPATPGDIVPAALGLGASGAPMATLRLNGRDPLYQVFPTSPKQAFPSVQLALDANGKVITNDRLWVSKWSMYSSLYSYLSPSSASAVTPQQNTATPALDPATHTFELFLDGKPTGPPVTLPYDRAFDPRWLVYVFGNLVRSSWNPDNWAGDAFTDFFNSQLLRQTGVRYFEVEFFDSKGCPQISDQAYRVTGSGSFERRAVMAMLVGRADRAGQVWQQADLTDDSQGANWQYPDSHWVVVLPGKGNAVVEPCAPVASRATTAPSNRVEMNELFEATAHIRQTVLSLLK